MTKKAKLTLEISDDERRILKQYAEQNCRSMNSAFRAWIRSLEPLLTDRQRAKLQPEELSE